MELWQCVIAVSTKQVKKCTVIITPCLSKIWETIPAQQPSMGKSKGLIDIHTFVCLSLNELFAYGAALEDEWKGEKKKLPWRVGSSPLDTVRT